MKWARVAAVVLSVSLAVPCGFGIAIDLIRRRHDWPAETVETLKAQGLELSYAVARYRREHGRLPPRPDDLVPRHLPALPTPPPGCGPWELTATGRGDDGMGFELFCFSNRRLEFLRYDSPTGQFFHTINRLL